MTPTLRTVASSVRYRRGSAWRSPEMFSKPNIVDLYAVTSRIEYLDSVMEDLRRATTRQPIANVQRTTELVLQDLDRYGIKYDETTYADYCEALSNKSLSTPEYVPEAILASAQAVLRGYAKRFEAMSVPDQAQTRVETELAKLTAQYERIQSSTQGLIDPAVEYKLDTYVRGLRSKARRLEDSPVKEGLLAEIELLFARAKDCKIDYVRAQVRYLIDKLRTSSEANNWRYILTTRQREMYRASAKSVYSQPGYVEIRQMIEQALAE